MSATTTSRKRTVAPNRTTQPTARPYLLGFKNVQSCVNTIIKEMALLESQAPKNEQVVKFASKTIGKAKILLMNAETAFTAWQLPLTGNGEGDGKISHRGAGILKQPVQQTAQTSS
jgi:hypothetical protein